MSFSKVRGCIVTFGAGLSGTELTIALILDKAKQLQIHPGIYCQFLNN